MPAVLRVIGLLVLTALLIAPSWSAEDTPSHGLSIFGDLKYGPDFAHFDYVNPDAPKGGTLSMVGVSALTTFDSFNPFILKGDSPEGLTLLDSDTGGSLIYDSLMVRAGDEQDSLYGLVAASVALSPDRRVATFFLRQEARWHDGTPLTAEDVVFTVEAIKEKGHPLLRFPMQNVIAVCALDPHTVSFEFAEGATRDLPLFVAMLPIASKAYYTTHDFGETTLERPLGSGPYKVGDFKAGSYIVYDRVPDYWAKDLPVNRGRWNFKSLRYEFYRDRTIGFQAFKSGAYDLREEFTSKTWATEYKFHAVDDGRVQRLVLADDTMSGTQGFFLNARRPQLKDRRVRHALDLAFDFTWLNRNMFFGMYARTTSYFQNSTFEAKGPPSAAELALLEPFRDTLPPEVFEEAYVPPATDGSGNNRVNLRAARALLEAAGWTVQKGRLVDGEGRPFTIEFLEDDPRFAEITAPFLQDLKTLGIVASVRLADPAQLERRRKAFDFDTTVSRYTLNATPGVELREFFGSAAATADGSRNLAGIDDPVVDALIEAVVNAKTRDDHAIACRALDRVLRAGHYWIANWYKAEHHIAYWDKFSRPQKGPRFQRGIIDTWWYDSGKAAAIAKAK